MADLAVTEIAARAVSVTAGELELCEESVSLSYHVVIANGAWDRARVEAVVSAWLS